MSDLGDILRSLFVPLSGYDISDMIGRGQSADVYKARNKQTGEIVALKIYKMSFDSEQAMNQYVREVETMARLHHPAILGIRGYSVPAQGSTDMPSIATELMEHGTLLDMLLREASKRAPKAWTQTKKSIVLFGIACGMMYIHNHHGIHRDLKPANILLDSNFEPRIADFGLSKIAESESLMSIVGGTPLWMAPELFENQQYTNKVDVFAFAMIVYQIVVGKLPFDGKKNPLELASAMMNGERPEIPPDVPDFFRKMIIDCWAQDPEARPSFDEIVDRLWHTETLLLGTKKAPYREYQERVLQVMRPKGEGYHERKDSDDADLKARIRDGNIDALYEYGQKMLARGKGETAARFIIAAANGGLIEAQLHAAKMHEDGTIVQKNETQAAVFYKYAADAGNADAQLKCGKILEEGIGVNQNLEKALKYYKMAAEQGRIDAMMAIGNILVGENPNEAASYFARAADLGSLDGALLGAELYERLNSPEAIRLYEIAGRLGNPEAIFNCGRLYEQGTCIPPNVEKAKQYYQLAYQQGHQEAGRRLQQLQQSVQSNAFSQLQQLADSGDVNSCYQLGVMLFESGDRSQSNIFKAASYLKKAALAGNTDAQYRCGQLLENGIAVAQDHHKAAYFYKLAADSGHPDSLFCFGKLLAQGLGVPQDVNNANNFFRAAADRGHLQAQLTYAYNMDAGVGGPQNPVVAAAYYRKAADQNCGSALVCLGVMAQNGRGMMANPSLAFDCYQRAARLGEVLGEYNFAFALQHGIGVQKNDPEAARFYKMAADKGYADAQCNYAILISGGGHGVTKNLQEAKSYAKLAADQNSPTGQCLYAQLLMQVDKNKPEAIRYFQMAAAQGNQRAQRKLAELGM